MKNRLSADKQIYFTLCQDGKVLGASQGWLSLFGYEMTAITGLHFIEFGLLTRTEQIARLSKSLRKCPHIIGLHAQMHSASGMKIHCSLNGYRAYQRASNRYEYTIYVDQTSSKISGEPHEASDAMWHSKHETRVAAWLVDIDKRIISSRSERADLAGPPELVSICHWDTTIHWDGVDTFSDLFHMNGMLTNDIERRYATLVGQDGTHTSLVATIVRPSNIAPLYFVSIYLQESNTSPEQDHSILHSNISLRMQQVAQVGGWQLDVPSNELTWTSETKKIHAVPDHYLPTVEEALSFYAPEVRETITNAVQRGIDCGESWDLELPIQRADGRLAWARAAGEADMVDGKVIRIFGVFQDITQRVQREAELREARCWMDMACNSGRVGLWSLDAVDGSVTWNKQMANHFSSQCSTPPASLVEWLGLLPEAEAQSLKAHIKSIMAGESKFQLELNRLEEMATHKTFKLTGQAHRDQQGFTLRILGSCIDISSEKNALTHFERQNQHMRTTLESIVDGVITTDAGQRITWMNTAAEELLCCRRELVVGSKFNEEFDLRLSDKNGVDEECIVNVALHSDKAFAMDDCILSTVGRKRTLVVSPSVAPIKSASGEILGAVLVFKDLSEQRMLSSQIEYRATHDTLTDILNRSELTYRYTHFTTNEIKRDLFPFLFYIDVDHFKKVNDVFGHEVGDILLQKIARCVKDHFDKDALVGRYGGDEFVVVSHERSFEEAESRALDLCEKIGRTSVRTQAGISTTPIGASIGIAEIEDPMLGIEVYLRRADIATYAAKHSGRGQARVWSPESTAMLAAEQDSCISKLLDDALESDGFQVFGQRIAAASSDGAEMTELLIRLADQNGKLLSPGSFLSAAERYGMLPRIDLWMLDRCIEVAERTFQPNIYTVNFSGHSMGSKPFRDEVLERLSSCENEVCRRMCFEITEDTMIANLQDASSFLEAVRTYGVKVAIDDFGSGASSFRYLREMPADILKIDGSFIRNMADPVSLTALKCFIEVAKLSGLHTVAEHVESLEQCSVLTSLGIDFLQGFALARPVRIDDVLPVAIQIGPVEGAQATLH